MSWKVTVWCTDCGNGQDSLGCFDGASETFEERWATRADAEAFALRQQIDATQPESDGHG